MEKYVEDGDWTLEDDHASYPGMLVAVDMGGNVFFAVNKDVWTKFQVRTAVGLGNKLYGRGVQDGRKQKANEFRKVLAE